MHMKPQSARISIFANAKTERVYKASTGLSISEFNELALDVASYYDPILPQDVIEPYGTASSIEDAKELLFLVLYHHKTAVTYDVLGLSFGISNGVAFNYVQLGKQILKTVLTQKDCIPKRLFTNKAEFDAYFQDTAELRIDATECPTQRPVNQVDQEARYTSKKNITV